ELFFGDFLHRVDVYARRGDIRTQPVEEQHRRREGEFLANVGDAEGVRDGPEHQRSRVWQEPPAASIFSLAAALKACACTSSFFEISPRARILTGGERFARPPSFSVSGFTSAPASKRSSRSATLTGCVAVRKFSNGIDVFLCGPRSFRIRMWSGLCLPS